MRDTKVEVSQLATTADQAIEMIGGLCRASLDGEIPRSLIHWRILIELLDLTDSDISSAKNNQVDFPTWWDEFYEKFSCDHIDGAAIEFMWRELVRVRRLS